MPGRGPGTPVRFVVAPFLPVFRPTLGVSSLVGVLRRAGIESRVDYLSLDYRQRVGSAAYLLAADGIPIAHLLGDALFARALWGARAPAWAEYTAPLLEELERLRAVQRCDFLLDHGRAAGVDWSWEAVLADLERVYEVENPRIVAGWARALAGARPRVVGFTTTFQQNVAALATAAALRRLCPPPEVTILFGGGNCEGEMGEALAESFPFIDCVVGGEGEGVIVELVQAALAGQAPRRRVVTGLPVEDMDGLPYPVFDDYFAVAPERGVGASAHLVAESSRGCWWGARSHCTFCGMNGATMAFRAKSPDRMAAEFRHLAARHGRRTFLMADNIMDARYADTLLPRLVDDDLRLFYEVKANLRREQVVAMARAGVVWIQPGIESLSTPVLRLMAKGTTRLTNLQLLRWCRELDIRASWNILFGFPGEGPEEYAAMSSLVPLLVHLEAPAGCVRIRLDRFSPYHKAPERHGLEHVRPARAYDWIYRPLAADVRRRLAFFFDYDYADRRSPAGYVAGLLDSLDGWYRASREGARLELVETDDGPAVYDTRAGDVRLTPVAPAERAMLGGLDTARGRDALLAELGPGAGETLARLLARGWVIAEGGRLLSLVVDRRDGAPGWHLARDAVSGLSDLAGMVPGPGERGDRDGR
jgi:ribosomal peptide maturation radical SAM protein 1